MKKILSQTSFLILLGCHTGTQTGTNCAGTLAVGSGDVKLENPGVVPAGGYVGFADRGCTATFSLLSADNQTIKLNAFTASHCSRDDKAENEKITISIYLPSNVPQNSGYVKNIPARDEFYERRSEFLAAVRGLNNQRASYIAEAISRIPSFGKWFGLVVSNGSTLSAATDVENRNLCLLKGPTDETFKNANYKNCWSVFDTGMRTLELRKSELGEKKFQIISQHLRDKQQEQKKYFSANPNIAKEFDYWTTKIQGRMGGFRLLNYVKLAAFLNFEMCSKHIPSNSPEYAACSVRQNLIDLANKYLVETDIEGKRKTMIQKAQELGLGITTPIPVDTYIQPFNIAEFQEDMESRADKDFLHKFNADIAEIAQLLSVKNNIFTPPSASFTVATNISPSKSTYPKFGLTSLSSIGITAQGVNAQGLSQNSGIFKLYYKQSQSKVTFDKGDSGSMMTIAGIVPILALNTVNDQPTSGGASILALPEPQAEDVSAGSASICR